MVATNLIALLYPPGAAGKTIATAMGLSTDAVLLDSYTASQNLTSGEKFNFLESSIREYLNSNNSKWHDIKLGNKNLFGESVRSAIVNKHPIHNYENSDLIEKLIQDNKFFFIILHDFESLNFVKEKFGPVRTIVIKNIKKLLKFRKNNMLDDRHPSILNKFENLIDSYNIVKGDTWPKTLPTTNNELLALPPTIYNEIITTFNTDIHFEYLKFYVNDDTLLDKLMPYSVNYKYNADNLLSPDTFLNSIRDLYTVFGLTDFKKVKHYILDYYKLWAAINLQQDCEVDNIPIIC